MTGGNAWIAPRCEFDGPDGVGRRSQNVPDLSGTSQRVKIGRRCSAHRRTRSVASGFIFGLSCCPESGPGRVAKRFSTFAAARKYIRGRDRVARTGIGRI